MFTTNYYNTFIEVSASCPVTHAEVPPQKDKEKSVTNIIYEMIKNNPYKFTSDEILFHVHATKNNISEAAWKFERQKYFSKAQPCLRASTLSKRYGWGIHFNAEGKVAIYALESSDYRKLLQNKNIKIIRGMRTKRK